MPGVGPLSAAKIVAETADVKRFLTKGEAAFARYAGTAPVPNWSGGQTPTSRRMLPTRRGNRQLNAALHCIAVAQIRSASVGSSPRHSRKATCSKLQWADFREAVPSYRGAVTRCRIKCRSSQ
jgi:transposase